jgi:hypothetical protein
LQIKSFNLESWSPGAGFFSIVAIAIINLSLRIRDSDFKNNFVIMKKEKDKHVLKNSLRDIPVPMIHSIKIINVIKIQGKKYQNKKFTKYNHNLNRDKE